MNAWVWRDPIARDRSSKQEEFSITDLAEEFSVTPRTLRFYEDKQLLAPRRVGMNRIYSRRDRARLKLILRAKRHGFSLAEIKEILDLYDAGDGQVSQAKVSLQKARERVAALEVQRRELDEIIDELKSYIRYVQGWLRDKGIAGEGGGDAGGLGAGDHGPPDICRPLQDRKVSEFEG